MLLRRCRGGLAVAIAACWLVTLTSVRAAEPSESDDAKSHWAFQPLRRPALPTAGAAWCQTPIDRFIAAGLSRQRLVPTAAASRAQLLRRIAFDLVGLPPQPEELDAFISDRAPNAYEKAVDRLLASPAYGERWGRHWLDLARFGESDGFEHDTLRTNAWRYRDYVIEAFNSDKPYDQFLLEQIAGDELFPQDMAALTATGFNLLGPDMADAADQTQRRVNTLSDITDTTGLVFLGLTIGCARCHDHKFEPISQRDYFQLQAFFTGAEFTGDIELAPPAERARRKELRSEHKQRRASLEKQIAELKEPVIQELRKAKLALLAEDARIAHGLPVSGRSAAQKKLVDKTRDKLQVSDSEISAALNADDRARLVELRTELASLKAPASLPAVPALQTGPATNTYVLVRGDYTQPGDLVQPGFPAVLWNGNHSKRASPAARADLARWLADPAHPLTARVMVNRIWQYHFGRGLVGSPSDFGLRGMPPTHPELLDWLASEFIATGWSLKKMHKLILLSAVYQQSSVAADAAVGADPDNRWYGRFSRIRLEGEVIRDTLLAISEELNLKMGGPGIFPPLPPHLAEAAKAWPVSANVAEHRRRSAYIFVRRNLRFPFLEVFDAPDTNLSCPVRPASTTAPQALTLLNSEQMIAASHATARRIAEQGGSPDDQVAALYWLALGREPTTTELKHCREFLGGSPLHELCRAVFNLNAFVYVD